MKKLISRNVLLYTIAVVLVIAILLFIKPKSQNQVPKAPTGGEARRDEVVQKSGVVIPDVDTLQGPFSRDMAVWDNGLERYDYLITPQADKVYVLKTIKEITGQEGLFMQEEVTIISDQNYNRNGTGNLYQLRLPTQTIFQTIDKLKVVLGAATDVGFIYKQKVVDRPLMGVSGATTYDVTGNLFPIIQKISNSTSSIVYADKTLPDIVRRYLETHQITSGDVFFLDMRRGIFITGDHQSRTISIHRRVEKDWRSVFSHTYDFVGGFTLLESPNGAYAAISFSRELGDERAVSMQSIIVQLADGMVVTVSADTNDLFPTFWINNNELAYGTAVGKDCGYYPHEAHYNLSQGTFLRKDESRSYSYEKYLPFDGVVYGTTGYRIAEVTEGSQYVIDSMCGGILTHKLVGLSEVGNESVIYEASGAQYLEVFGFVDPYRFLFAVVPVLESTSARVFDRRLFEVNQSGTPVLYLFDTSTKAITAFSLAQLESAARQTADGFSARDFTLNHYSSIVSEGSVLDIDRGILILKHNGVPLDRLDMVSRLYVADDVRRSGYQLLDHRVGSWDVFQRALGRVSRTDQ